MKVRCDEGLAGHIALESSVSRALSLVVMLVLSLASNARASATGPGFEITLASTVGGAPITGRAFLIISRRPEPMKNLDSASVQVFGVAVDHLRPGQSVIVDDTTLGYPFRSLVDVPPGDYYIQAYFNQYVEYTRADGHTLWGLDQWDGQEILDHPGNILSDIEILHFDRSDRTTHELSLTHAVTKVLPTPADTRWIKHIKFKSERLSKFWGRPIYLGAQVLLPRGYDEHPHSRYPVIYEQKSHYLRGEPLDVEFQPAAESEVERQKRLGLGYETGYEFFQSWSSERFPRMILVRISAPTPFYDFSSAMNSDNNGPFGDAIVSELIPYIESQFRIVSEPHARILVGKSTGGRDALALQIFHSDLFGGAWIFYPWGIDFRRYEGFDIYHTKNAFLVDGSEVDGDFGGDEQEWVPRERYWIRTLGSQPYQSVRQLALSESVGGGRSGVGVEVTGSEDALSGPTASDGYPTPLYNKLTGEINQVVASYWRRHDLADYTATHWHEIGPHLVGKLHFFVGDMDEYLRNYGVHHFQEILEETTNPHEEGVFTYGPLKGHLWQPMTNAQLVRDIADFVALHAPQGESESWRRE